MWYIEEDMEEQYEISEKDIESAIRWLKVNDPENATREKAVALLKDLKAGFRGIAHNNPDKLLKLQQELDSNTNDNGQN